MLTGKAKTTLIIYKEEFLVVEINAESEQIRLDRIKNITALDDNAEFKTVEIN